MRILIACEESQAITREMRKLGHEAYSCDIVECSGGHPEWHIICDALQLLKMKWDMIIAHPPCTYMSNAGACRMYPTAGQIDQERFEKAMQAKEFFMKFLNADCDKICVENPRPLKCVGLPVESQRIQPYQFGDPFSKLTYLWLRGLPPLIPTNIVPFNETWIESSTSKNKGTQKNINSSKRKKLRSKTFPGIAKAIAEQWAGKIS